ncbi:MAG TPA: alpha/beta fold hydrolase [Microbacteriaceae bacterium]|nr:alpha/beta fold hydrolase [Microbacteriaceae bacterium]
MTIPTIVATAHESNASGPLLVLGPSLGSDGAILWELVVPLLRDRYRIVSWDLPGHGRSPATAEPFSIADLADAVAGLVDELGADTAFHAGVSIGGGTGLELALRHPDRFVKVALVCSNHRFGGDAWPDTWLERAATVRAQSTSALIVSSAQRWFTPASIAEHADTTGRLLHALQHADDASYALCCEALAAFDAEGRLGEITVPVLDIWGDQDETISLASAEHLVATVPDGRLVIIEDAAHLGTVDQPEAVARELIAFFD